MPPGALGQHVKAGAFLGYAVTLGTDQTPAATWEFSSNFDVAVVEGDDSVTMNYFAKRSGPAFVAWAARGVTVVSQTQLPSTTSCPGFSSYIGEPGILSFTPSL